MADQVAVGLGADTLSGAAALPRGLLEAPSWGWDDPWLLGAVYERAAPAGDRKSRGAWYTPHPVAAGLVRLATEGRPPPELFVDLCCGGGAFLLAVLDYLADEVTDPVTAVGRVAGMDLDPDAVVVSRWSVVLWLMARIGPRAAAEAVEDGEAVDLHVGDSLAEVPDRWLSRRVCFIGNPPFASPLKSGAVPAGAAAFREQRADLLGPYADIAAAHLLRAVDVAGPGSVVALVQPQSVLSSRDTEPLRRHLDAVAPMWSLWVAREAVFDAGVRACAPVLEVGGEPGREVGLASGPEVTVGERSVPVQPWGCLGADALGAPPLPDLSGRLGSLAPATAGFRDEHYGLVAACRERDQGARDRDRDGDGDGDGDGRLVTVGSVDPLTVAWGREQTRFGGRRWDHPVIDPAALEPKVRSWYERQRRPKVLLATQAKLLEPVVDRSGDLVPATPLIAVHAQPDDLDRVAAVLLAPPVVAWAWRRWFGTALAVDAVKLAASQVAELPLPVDDDAWGEAADLVARADGASPDTAWDQAVEVAKVMTGAYGASREVFDWWYERLKPRPDPGSPPGGTKIDSSQSFPVR